MPEYTITATINGQTAYYNAFDLMNGRKLLITPHLVSAYKFRTLPKAEGWQAWLEKKFPDYTYQIKPVQ